MSVLKHNIDMFATNDLAELFYIPKAGILKSDWKINNTYKYSYRVIIVKK